ncbi:MAG: hypothetical protein A2283_05805 [Lentisphaerae bacterium RIFOXYA12_FULL_48_11]|nr:MAG: hypothetical protein A2283_05805 [Lentisphaerae bacterium RIFOXYA12_FULL_48_11]
MTDNQRLLENNSGMFDREIAHGQRLANSNPQNQWGWGTPAGQKRALRRARLIVQVARLNKEMNVLEVGCGTGFFSEQFAACGCKLIAVDVSPDLLALARKRTFPLNNVRFEQKPFEECANIGPFDAIIGSSVLHHLTMPLTWKIIHDLLKPGSYMVFAEPNYMNPQVWLERKFRRLFPYVSHDETAFWRWEVCRELKRADFEDICITPFDWLHPSTPELLIPLVSGLGYLVEHVPGIREFSGSLLISARKPIQIVQSVSP